jgi:hypothetical protein
MESYSHLALGPEVTAEKRFRYFGSIEGVEEPSVTGPSVSRQFQRRRNPIRHLTRWSRFTLILNDGDTTKIDEAIKKGRSIAASSHKALHPRHILRYPR